MKTAVVLSGVAMLVFWALGFFMFQFSSLIHAALIVSAILFLRCAIISPKQTMENKNKPVLKY